MDSGVTTFCTHDSMRPDDLARLVEARGHRWLFFSEHTHIPASRATPFPGGAALPPKYWHTHDLFVALSAAAMATSTLRVGSGICLIVQRDTITTAKEVASIDHLSGGRFEFGIGAGWNREEMANHGTDFDTRFSLMAERVAAMKAIWTQDEASYHGAHVSFDRIWSYPKPLQRPHPPVLIGGLGPRVGERVLAYGDGWMPFAVPGLPDRIRELRARANEISRPVMLYLLAAPTDPRALDEYARAGVERFLFEVPAARQGPVERALESAEDAMAEAFGS
jgi:probable F420-dependent oxidoreductase